jgi:hypothetical protein
MFLLLTALHDVDKAHPIHAWRAERERKHKKNDTNNGMQLFN